MLTTSGVEIKDDNNIIMVAVIATVLCVTVICIVVFLGTGVLCVAILYKKKGKKWADHKPSVDVEPEGLGELDSKQGANEHKEQAGTDGLEEEPGFDVPEPTYAIADHRRVIVKKGTAEKELVDPTTSYSPYVEIAAHQHEEQVYAHVTVDTPNQDLPGVGMDVLQVEYAVLDHNKLVDKVEEQEAKEDTLPALPPKPIPLNTETLHALLTPAASKWYEIGLAIGVPRSTLENEVYPGNSTDWLRLGEICPLFFQYQYKHSWEGVVHILWVVEEWELADKICRQERLEIERPVPQVVDPPPSLPPKAAEK